MSIATKRQTMLSVAALLAVAWPAGTGHSQRPEPSLIQSRQIVTPNTAQNIRLVEAVRRADLAGVQAALAHGANPDTRLSWAGESGSFPVALLAANDMTDTRAKFLPVFRLLIQHVSSPNAVDQSGRTLLMAAVDMNDLESVRRLVEAGADVNAQTNSSPVGSNALYWAVTQGGDKTNRSSPVAIYLIDHGAAVNTVDENGETPLMLAALGDKMDIVRALLARGADPALRNKRGWTALRWASARGWSDVVAVLRDKSPMDIREAAQFGDVARLRAHLDAGEDVNAGDAQGMTPLMAAMGSGSVETARLLLDRGADVHRRERTGRTALHLAALCGDAALAAVLLDHRADINAATSAKTGAATPLTEAVSQAEADVVALLLKRGADIRGDQGAAALDIAIRQAGNGFIRRPMGVSASKAPHGDAVYDARERVIDLLLAAGVDVRANHSHALFIAASNGQAGLIELILNKGADVNGRETLGPAGGMDNGQTALTGAVTAWIGSLTDEEMVKNGSLSGPDMKDIREGQRLAQQSVRLLLARGADVNLPDSQGTTPLMQCVSSNLPALSKLLLAHGAKVDAADAQGQTALLHAAAEDDRAFAALLLAHHANINHMDAQGRTALMLAIDDGSNDEYREIQAEENGAAHGTVVPRPTRVSTNDLPNQHGHPEMVRLLLIHGAAVNAVAKDGMTALSLARKQGFQTVSALLTRAGAKR